MKLVLIQFVTLDGVSQGPGSPEEDRSNGFTQGGWLVPHMDEAFIDHATDNLQPADALLLGRRTYDAFALDWPKITDPNDPFTTLMNSLPKYAVSHSMIEPVWNPTTVLTGNVVEQIAFLKEQPGRELQIHGSSTLSQSLLGAGLIDEIRLAIAPVIVGEGRRLFPVGGAPAGLQLIENKVTPGGLTLQSFAYTGAPDYSTYEGVTELLHS